MTDIARPCPACGRELFVVDVHGHGQCAACGVNIDPCCQGASGDLALDTGLADRGVALLRSLVGAAPVSRETLLNLAAARSGCPWSEVEAWLAAAIAERALAVDVRTRAVRRL